MSTLLSLVRTIDILNERIGRAVAWLALAMVLALFHTIATWLPKVVFG